MEPSRLTGKDCLTCVHHGKPGSLDLGSPCRPCGPLLKNHTPVDLNARVPARVDYVDEPDRYPDDNPKTRFGVAKPPIALIPGTALVIMAEAFRDGCKKYGPANWREKPVTTSTYTSAVMRHLLAWIDGEQEAPDSGVHHLGHAMSCLAILVDAQTQGTLNDDRPTPGRTSQLIDAKTKPLD